MKRTHMSILLLSICLFSFVTEAVADIVLYDFNISYSNIHEKVPNAGATFSDIHITAKTQFEYVDTYSDFSDPEFGFEDTNLRMSLINTELVGGPFATSYDWSGLNKIELRTSYTVDNFDGETFINRDAMIVFVDKSPSSGAPFYQLGNVQIVHDLTQTQYNDMRQLLLDEDPILFINQFLSMNPHNTPFNAYRYDQLPGGWSAWWAGTQSSFSVTPEPATLLLLALGGLFLRKRKHLPILYILH